METNDLNVTNGGGVRKGRAKPSPEQERIIEADPREDLLVVAGAGSGKTHTMTERIIKLIVKDKVSPERILGLTFTRMAAGELLSRVGNAVDKVAHENGNSGASSSLRPEVHTYDAFFQQIVRQYGLLIGVDQNVVPLSEQGRYQLAAKVVGDHLDELYAHGGMDDKADGTESKDGDKDKDDADDDQPKGKLGNAVKDLLQLNSNVLSYMISSECLTFEEAVATIREYDKALKTQLVKVDGDIEEQLKKEFNGNIPDKVPNKPRAPQKSKKTGEIPQEKIDAYNNKMKDWQPVHDAFIARDGIAEVIEATDRREMLLDLAQAYQDAKRDNGLADYADFTMFALQLINRFPTIGEDYRRRFSNVFLDEYQDTSTTQALLLAKLFSATDKDGRPVTAVTAVGDPYQSIYSWRGASPGAFRMFKDEDHFNVTDDPLPMTVTRRNPAIVLDVANAVTAVLRQEPSIPTSASMEEVPVSELRSLSQEDVENSAGNDVVKRAQLDPGRGAVGALAVRNITQEAEAVARFARHEVDVRNREDRKRGPNDPAVAVLFRSKANMRVFAKAIEAKGLTCEVVGTSTLIERPEIKDVLAVLACMTDHSDVTALMRLLGTPRFDVTARGLERLAKIATDINKERGLVMLMHAGLLSKDADDEACQKALAEYRNQLPPAMMLIDLVMSDDSATQRRIADALGARDGARVAAAGAALRVAERVGAASIKDALHAATEALGIDIDLIVAQAFRNDADTADASVRASLESLDDLADTYVGELPASMEPSVPGFLAWIRSGSTGVEDTSAPKETHCDVRLMTIHQAKGLQWCAVAVPQLANGKLPTNQGGVKVTGAAIKDWSDLETFDGDLTIDGFTATARTWLTQASDVPVPVRSDSGILPRFPHDADDADDVIDALEHLDGPERFMHEYENTHKVEESGSGSEDDATATGKVDTPETDEPPYLSQKEEWGRRAHADERRLAYVAMTRASNDMLLTYSTNNDSQLDKPFQEGVPDLSTASPFWTQAAMTLTGMDGHVKIGGTSEADADGEGSEDTIDASGDASEDDAAEQSTVSPAFAVFAGRDARELADAVAGEPFDKPDEDAKPDYTWPRSLNGHIGEVLRESARLVESAMQDHADNTGESSASNSPETASAMPQTLTGWAERLLESDGMAGSTTDGHMSKAEDSLTARGEAVLRGRPRGVTSLRNRVDANESQRRRFYMNLLRPVPQAPSHVANLGTRFHEWAEAYLNAVIAPMDDADGVPTTSREEMEADLAAREAEIKVKAASHKSAPSEASQPQLHPEGAGEAKPSSAQSDDDDRRLARWERRLVESPWAERTPLGAEQPIVFAVGGQPVTAIIDAVFAGGLEDRPGEESADRVTIVDWKTGRKPTTAEARKIKLSQLDMYRLAWSRHSGMPLERIDAVLYYTDVADPKKRQLRAEPRTEDEILWEFDLANPDGCNPEDVEEDAAQDQ